VNPELTSEAAFSDIKNVLEFMLLAETRSGMLWASTSLLERKSPPDSIPLVVSSAARGRPGQAAARHRHPAAAERSQLSAASWTMTSSRALNSDQRGARRQGSRSVSLYGIV